MKRFKTWFKALTMTGKTTTIAIASILSLGTFGAMAQSGTPSTSTPPTTQTQKAQPKIEIKTITSTEAVPFASSSVDDPNLTQGTTEVRTAGVNGVRTLTHEVTLTDGVETARKEVSNSITTQPINEVVAKGTKAPIQVQAQPSCPNGTYVNTYGNTVCRPYESNSAPAGASAQCEDGTYSFSQSRRGTCSGHGGVAVWL
jgi:resuscitation-promoting factor RpfB